VTMMSRTCALVASLFLLSQAVFSQPLTGTWVADQPLLSMVHFSLTFHPDMTYEIDTVLGKTTGDYRSEDNRIVFTPIKIGINGGSVAAPDVYPYSFRGEDILYLNANGREVKLIRTRS